MKLFNLFRKKQKLEEKTNKTSDDFLIEKIELTPNAFHDVSKKQYMKEVQDYFDLEKYGFGISEDQKIKVFVGDINSEKEINFSDHLLVVGNVKSKWVNLTSENYRDSGGSLFVTGNIESDYFSNDFEKFVMLNGSLIVEKIINTEFENSFLYVKKDLVTEYFHGIDIEAEVLGNVKMNYGWGCCLSNEKKIFPKNDLNTSMKFLGIDENCNSEIMNKIIKNRIVEG